MKYDPDNIEHQEMKARSFYENRYRAVLGAHPKCNDPDHPGCHLCEDDDEYEDETEYK